LLDFPAFDSLMGGAFSQDWKDESSSANEVLSKALDGFPATRGALALELLDIRTICQETDVIHPLESIGSGFQPEVDADMSALGWVDYLVGRISELDAADA
jgi:hypothetical protein